MLHPTDQLAFDKAMVTQPVWNRFNTASDAVNLPDNVLLHAGPALFQPGPDHSANPQFRLRGGRMGRVGPRLRSGRGDDQSG